jgi:DNA mismatch repair protein MutS
MAQYREIKGRHQDAILMFRMGDFFEMFYEDAQVAARDLGLTLTSRNNGGAAEVPLAGVPVKAAPEYLRRLVQKGHKVAICEQLEDPKLAKGVVKRGVVETVTPGAAFSDDLLDGARNNFLVAVHVGRDAIGLAAADVSTGELRLVRTTSAGLDTALARLAPREVLVARGVAWPPAPVPSLGDGVLVTSRDGWEFDVAMAADELARQFAVKSLEGFGVEDADEVAVAAGGALLRYLRELQPSGVPHLARPVMERDGATMPLDEMTRRNLELVESLRGAAPGRGGSAPAGTLLDVLDRTLTPMGQRRMRQWLLAPLLDRATIEARLSAVGALVADPIARSAVREALDGVRDLERLASKAAARRATPRELRALGDSLTRLPSVAAAVRRVGAIGTLADVLETWVDAAELASEITTTLSARPPIAIGDGEETIARGVDAELDALRDLETGGKDAIAQIQTAERARTGITSLKVGYNRVFGYFIEITNANRHLVPDDYQRKQTLTGAERYVTPALKEYEEKILSATERIESRERSLFEAVRDRAGAAVAELQGIAGRCATLDVLAAFAESAERESYVRPELHDGFALTIVAGRHPVVERMMPRDQFIPNDVTLTPDARVIILTGPNMAGKSTILRQIGLIQLMAQVGCWVPASQATLPIVDRLFTRVGASDNLVRGQSTFMVEMAETSAILHSATSRSLVLLDEIGRGTSTYDGVSIAWSVTEHVHERLGCKTVFATHYHELTSLADELVAVRNYNVSVREVGDQVLFLHRLQPGGADRSYGIEVGRLAGLPPAVIARAKEVLRHLEGEQLAAALAGGAPARRPAPPSDQLALFAALPHPALERLRGIDVNALTPLQALALLDDLSRSARHDA